LQKCCLLGLETYFEVEFINGIVGGENVQLLQMEQNIDEVIVVSTGGYSAFADDECEVMQVSLFISLFLAWSWIVQREITFIYYFYFSLHICSLLTITRSI